MKVYKVIRPIKDDRKKLTGPKIVYLRREPLRSNPFVVQIYTGNVKTGEKDFINKSAALDWIELNAKSIELKDLTGNEGVRTHIIKTT